ncbi:MAG: hypothetical protein PHF63_02160 [Herbinix sp.]|jgi:hypothetical protein|nr:hypothetical protein [Herbinix sp.]
MKSKDKLEYFRELCKGDELLLHRLLIDLLIYSVLFGKGRKKNDNTI